jgi:glutamate dehydrogenase/leucine dehydrogenase
LSSEIWPEEKVLERLKLIMSAAFHDVHDHCRAAKCRMRKAAYELAVKRILNAEKLRGHL